MTWKWDEQQRAALLAWKCNHRLMPCKESGYACPFVKEDSDVIQTKKCEDVTPWDWQDVLKQAED